MDEAHDQILVGDRQIQCLAIFEHKRYTLPWEPDIFTQLHLGLGGLRIVWVLLLLLQQLLTAE